MSTAPELAAAIQALLDQYGDGWSAAHYVLCLGLERVTTDGMLETATWCHTPPHQAEYVTDGLLGAIDAARMDIEP